MPELSQKEVSPAVRDLFEKGKLALQRENFDYAILVLTDVLEKEPGFYTCRELLRMAQFRKQGTSTSLFKRVMGNAGNSPLIAKGQIALRNNPAEALNIAEQILTSDPTGSAGHKLLAEAALALEMPRTAVLSLEILRKNNPKDRWINLRLGIAYAKIGQLDKGEAIFAELRRDHPRDPEVAMAYKNFSASRTLNEGGYDSLAGGTGSYRDILKDKQEAETLEQEHRLVKSADVASDLIVEYEARRRAEPDNLKLLRNMAELYAQKKDFDRALECYRQVVAKEGAADSALEKAMSDTMLRKLDHALEQLNPESPDYGAETAKIQAERVAFVLSDCQRRAERYPNDLVIRYELGRLYFETGKVSEAIQEFQRALASPHLKIAAMSQLGQCFARRGMNDMAARKFQEALKEKVGFDAEKKELLYALGGVLEKMGRKEDAIEQFKQIYEQDIGFKDVAAKVDAFYAGNQS